MPECYGSRDAWLGIDPYRAGVSGPASILGDARSLPGEVVRYVEVKCLIAGVTTTQGVSLARNQSIDAMYRGAVRNVESPGEGLPAAQTRIADVAHGDAAAFAPRVQTGKPRLLMHLAEGRDARARQHFVDLQLGPTEWAVGPKLTGIHSSALRSEDFAVLQAHGASVVWSPLSNLLYGSTLDIAAVLAAKVAVALGADWSPSGSKSLLWELKIAAAVGAAAGVKPLDAIRMATTTPAMILGWRDRLGVIAKGAFADLVVVAGSGGDPFAGLLSARERDITLVAIDGRPRYGLPALMARFVPVDPRESLRVAGRRRTIEPPQAEAHPLVQGITLRQARERLRSALRRLPAVAKALEDQDVDKMAAFGLAPAGQDWSLVLDQEGAGERHVDFLGGPDAIGLAITGDAHAAVAKPLSELVSPMRLDRLTVDDDPSYRDRILGNQNLSDAVRAMVASVL